MSGPKVVRIVTREELQTIGRGHMEKAAAAIQELESTALRHGKDIAAMASELARRHASLNALYQQDRWRDLQTQSGILADYVKSEAKRLRAEAISEARALRLKKTRIRDAALSLLAAYQAAGRQPSQELLQVAATADTVGDEGLAACQSILNTAYRDLNPTPASSAPTEGQKELAAQLGSGERTETFAAWLAGRSLEGDPVKDARLSPLLAEIESYPDRESARIFLERVRTIAREESEDRRALLTDSLVLDLSVHCRRIREMEASLASLGEIRAALIAIGSLSAEEMANRIAQHLDSLTADQAQILLPQAKTLLEAETRTLAAASRRRAVLEGLASLGYEVRENMSAAWVKEGRIVVGKPGATDYGVELGSTPDADRMQVRLVGSDWPMSPRDKRRDIDMETLWCSEFRQLQANLAVAGTDLVIEKAMGIGVQPVKTVPIANESANSEAKRGMRNIMLALFLLSAPAMANRTAIAIAPAVSGLGIISPSPRSNLPPVSGKYRFRRLEPDPGGCDLRRSPVVKPLVPI